MTDGPRAPVGSRPDGLPTDAPWRRTLVRLAQAIDNRREVRLLYGSSLSVRLVLPHALGVSRSGSPALLAWQKGGGAKEIETGWRQFNLNEIAAVDVSESTFRAPAPGYDPKNPGLFGVVKAI